ncbi:MAG TPA: 1-acyl-sn-glycerol-3-phosphate acyltransferase [Spirochaetota bacterium]|nr:1-acyl-sn-glycerol-3-phosphate acyltransferase [Spirochaetota bacterium]
MIRRLFREFIISCFHIASIIMRQRPHLKGREHLQKIPTPVIISPTHDSYYEIPSLARVYYSLHPRPDFLVLAKGDFLSGSYLASNFGKKNLFLKCLFTFLDKTALPFVVFKIMRLTTIHRPFIDTYSVKRERIRNEIGNQMNRARESIARGLSTLVFPEGTTWGFGGLKKIRSAVYQLVENSFQSAHQKVHVIPINVKVDRLVKGGKDIFINIGRPVFFRCPKEEFNERLAKILRQLHTITFSQIAAYYIRRLAKSNESARQNLVLARERFVDSMERITAEIGEMVRRKKLPDIDAGLLDRKYLLKKVNSFLKYCRKKRYLRPSLSIGKDNAFILDIEAILSSYSDREYRTRNPLGFHANELMSLGETSIRRIFDAHLGA